MPLTLFCLIQYGYRKVVNLTEKGFHLPMFLMILTCGILDTIAGALLLSIGVKGLDSAYNSLPAYKVAAVAISVSWGLDYFLHT